MSGTIHEGTFWACGLCGHTNATNSVQCENCGADGPSYKQRGESPGRAAIQLKCKACGQSVTEASRFCPMCGQNLVASNADETGHSPTCTPSVSPGRSVSGIGQNVNAPPQPHAGYASIPYWKVLSLIGAMFVACQLILFVSGPGPLASALTLTPSLLVPVAAYFLTLRSKPSMGLKLIVAVWASYLVPLIFLANFAVTPGTRTPPHGLLVPVWANIAAALITSAMWFFLNTRTNIARKLASVSDVGAKTTRATDSLSTPAKGDRCKNPTGIVSHAEHSLANGVGFQPELGEAGVIRRTDGIRDQRSYVEFRIRMLDDDAGSLAHLSVWSLVEKADIYVQDGDTITLLGQFAPNKAARNPPIVNHTSRVTMWPEEDALDFQDVLKLWWGVAFVLIPAFILVTNYPSSNVRLNFIVVAIVAIAGAFVLTGALWLADFAKRLREVSRQRARFDTWREEARNITSKWPARKYRDPQGIVEGFVSFVRGGQTEGEGKEPVPSIEWTIFRLAIYDTNGEIVDRMVWAIQSISIPGRLRRGDSVRVPGNWNTGTIARTSTVEIL